MATSQNGWSASADKHAIDVDSNFAIAGVKFPGGVRSGDVSTVLGYVAAQFHARVEPLRDGWCWGYAYRDISGGSSLSNHSAACAIDINAPSHPMGVRGTFNADQVREIKAIVAECHGVVRWGGTYSRPDEMHFEIVGTPGQVAYAARQLGSPPASSGTTILRRGSEGDAVRRLQRVLNAWYPHLGLAVDGDYGPATEAAVRELQRRARIAVDGIAGPQTLGVLGLR
jgi:hypothetical protein